jgi:hypothetical protein
MIISLYKAVNYKVIINQEILGVDIYNNVALINLLYGRWGCPSIKCAYDIPLASASSVISYKLRKPPPFSFRTFSLFLTNPWDLHCDCNLLHRTGTYICMTGYKAH